MTSRLHATAALAALLLAAAAPADVPLELVQTIPSKGKAGKLDHLALDARRERVFLADKANNTVDILDLKSGKLLKQLTGQNGVQGLAYAPDLDRLYVAIDVGGLFNVFDGGTYKPLKTLKFGDDADNVRYNAATGLIYVAHAGEVAVIDTDKNEVVGHFPVKKTGELTCIALDEPARRLYVAGRKEPAVVALDAETGKELASAAIPGGVDDLFLDVKHKRLYASCGEGFLAVVNVPDADHVEPGDKIATADGAKTCLFVPETGRLYLGVPRQAGKEGPEVRVYEVK